jgi:hypothetical protein
MKVLLPQHPIGGAGKYFPRMHNNLPKKKAAFSFLQSDNQKKEEGYPIAIKKKRPCSRKVVQHIIPRKIVVGAFSFIAPLTFRTD